LAEIIRILWRWCFDPNDQTHLSWLKCLQRYQTSVFLPRVPFFFFFLHILYFCLITLRPAAAAAAKSLQSCPTLCDPIDGSPPGSPRPWDSPGKNTGVGCHFLLQCMKVKSESEVTQSCLTPSDPMDCSLPGFSVHGIFQARVLEWVAIAFSCILKR